MGHDRGGGVGGRLSAGAWGEMFLCAAACAALSAPASGQLGLPGKAGDPGGPGAPGSGRPAVVDEELPDGSELVSVSLVPELRSIAASGAGATVWLAVRYEIDDGWHLYWRNPGSTGMPPTLRFDAPEGVTFGEAVWPVPERYPQPGGGLDYIFEDELVLLVPMTLAPGMEVDGTLSVGVSSDWLVCKDVCLPGAGEASATIDVGRPQADREVAALFDRARYEAPLPPSSMRALQVTAEWEGTELVLVARGAAETTFYPNPSDVLVEPRDAVRTGRSEGPRLRLPYGERVLGADRVGGVLEFARGQRTFAVTIDVAAPRPGGEGGAG